MLAKRFVSDKNQGGSKASEKSHSDEKKQNGDLSVSIYFGNHKKFRTAQGKNPFNLIPSYCQTRGNH